MLASWWENWKKLLQRSIWFIDLWAIFIRLKMVNSSWTMEIVLNNICVNIWNHRGIVVRIVPSPVLSSFVIIIKNPLETFHISLKHHFLLMLSLRNIDIKLKFLIIIKSLCSTWIILIGSDKFIHKLDVSFSIFVNYLLLYFDFIVNL